MGIKKRVNKILNEHSANRKKGLTINVKYKVNLNCQENHHQSEERLTVLDSELQNMM